jgi:hypothetical protein
MWNRLTKMLGGLQGDPPLDLVERHLPANRQIPTLVELGESANFVLETEYDYGPDAYRRSLEHSHLDLLRLQFAQCSSPEFARSLHELTGWPVITAATSAGRPIHYLNRDREDKLVDVTGFIDIGDIRARYGVSDLVILENAEFRRHLTLYDDDMAAIMAAMLYLPHEPFVSMRPVIELWVRHGRIGIEGPWRCHQPET